MNEIERRALMDSPFNGLGSLPLPTQQKTTAAGDTGRSDNTHKTRS